MKHQLLRTDGARFLVDTDLWLCLLALATKGGWHPHGTTEPDEILDGRAEDGMSWEPNAYFLPRGQVIAVDDASELSRCATSVLNGVSDEVMPLGGGPFGRKNTLHLLQLASRGEDIPESDVEAAVQIASGPPKAEALAVLGFVAEGAVRILPA